MCKCVGWGNQFLAKLGEGRRRKGKEKGEGERGDGEGFPNSKTLFICSGPYHKLSINLSQCKHSKYSLWLLVKTMRAARIKPSFQMSGVNHMKQGRLVYCCVWLGLFPPWGFKIEAAAGVEPQTQTYISGANLPTSMSIWGRGSLKSLRELLLPAGGLLFAGWRTS